MVGFLFNLEGNYLECFCVKPPPPWTASLSPETNRTDKQFVQKYNHCRKIQEIKHFWDKGKCSLSNTVVSIIVSVTIFSILKLFLILWGVSMSGSAWPLAILTSSNAEENWKYIFITVPPIHQIVQQRNWGFSLL